MPQIFRLMLFLESLKWGWGCILQSSSHTLNLSPGNSIPPYTLAFTYHSSMMRQNQNTITNEQNLERWVSHAPPRHLCPLVPSSPLSPVRKYCNSHFPEGTKAQRHSVNCWNSLPRWEGTAVSTGATLTAAVYHKATDRREDLREPGLWPLEETLETKLCICFPFYQAPPLKPTLCTWLMKILRPRMGRTMDEESTYVWDSSQWAKPLFPNAFSMTALCSHRLTHSRSSKSVLITQ